MLIEMISVNLLPDKDKPHVDLMSQCQVNFIVKIFAVVWQRSETPIVSQSTIICSIKFY